MLKRNDTVSPAGGLSSSQTGVVVTLTELLQLQMPARAMDFKPQKRVGTLLAGTHHATLRGRGMEFDEVRAYLPGDDVRNMDWRVTARRGIPHTKVYQEERERPVYVVVDFNPSMYFGTRVAFKSVVAAKLAALLSWTAVLGNDRIGGVLSHGAEHVLFKPQSRQHGLLPFLQAISNYSQQPPTESDALALSKALLNCRRMSKQGSLIFVISDFAGFNEETAQHLNRMAQHNQVFAIVVSDPLEQELPPPDLYAITNGQDQMLIDTRISQLRQQFRRYYQENRDSLKHTCHRAKIGLFEVNTSDDAIEYFRKTFYKATKRQVIC